MTNKVKQNRCVIRVLVLMLSILCTVEVCGQRRYNGIGGDNYHFGYVTGSVGYSMLDSHAVGVMPMGSLGGAVGIGYEFRNSGFWTSVGVQLSFHRSSLQLDAYNEDHEGFDTQGKEATFHYRVTQTDQMKWNFIDVPVMFGYYTHGFHLGAGLKVSYALSPTTHATGVYNLSATNHDYNVTFENMPDRGYKDYPFDNQQENRLNVGASIIGEIGYDLLSSAPTHSTICHVMKLSFYFEYGLNNLAKGWDETQKRVVLSTPTTDPSKYDATKVIINPYMNTLSAPQRTVPFFAGAKLTYMIGGSRTARAGYHKGCMCYN